MVVSGRLKAALAAVTAVAVVSIGVAVAANAADPAPQIAAGAGSCTTDAQGICTLKHTLGSVPDTIVVSANTPGNFNGFFINTLNGSYTATDFKVRAMFSQTVPKPNGTIWVSWIAYAKGSTPSPPPTTTTVVPPVSTTPPVTTTPKPPPTTVTPPPTSTPPPAGGCAKPDVLTEGEGGDWPPYYIHNNAWNWGEGTQHELLYACNYNNWWADIWGFHSPQGEVFMYPNTHLDIPDWHLTGKPLSTWPNQITGKFGGKVTNWNGGSYNVAWDLWLNGTGDGNELMVWTDYHNADPWGTKRGTYTDASSSKVYDVWWDGDKYLAFISQTTQLSGTVDLRTMITYSISKGYIPANPVVNQLDYGIEVRDSGTATQASPARFTLTDFALTMK